MSESGNQKYLVIFQPSGRRGYIREGKTIKEASRELGVDLEGVCGEKAICGKCRVRIEEGFFAKYGIESRREHLTPISGTERKFFNLQQERSGYRLACQACIQGNILVFVPEESRMGKQVVRKAATDRAIELKPVVRKYYVELAPATLDDPLGDWERLNVELSKRFKLSNLVIDNQVLLSLQKAIRQGDWKVTVSVWQDKEVIKVEPGLVKKGYGLAVDVGTTTVAGYLCDLTDGTVLATGSMMNPQVVFGEDVMSRITYTMTNPDGLEQMNKAIIDGLNGLIGEVAAQAGIKRQDILDMTIVGNTCMHHLFLNIDPLYIGRSPFAPSIHHSLDIKARSWGRKLLPEADTIDKGGYAPCQVACPAGVNAQDYLYLIAQDKFSDALELVRQAMPFAGVCGRVCTHPCEADCERGNVDEPLAIRSLHRFLADYELRVGREKAPPIERTKEDRVAIIGSGPAGLACAYELVRRGYKVTVFEVASQVGGLLRYGIPEYRLPKKVLDNEISYIEELGVEIKTNSPVKDLKDLFNQGYKAIFLAIGAGISQKIDIPNEDTKQVIHALDFLRQVNSGEKVEIGERVAVIGGGNAAVDTARVAQHLGAKEVVIVYRRSRAEMPAIGTEVDEAEQEGVKIYFLVAPVKVLTKDDRVTGIQCIRTELDEPDESGRKRPIPIKGSEFNIDVDNLIIAIGQTVDKTTLPKEFEYTSWGTVSADPVTLETNIKGVFAGGDMVSPASVITSIGAGKEAAISIELYLEGVDLKEGRPAPRKRVEEIPKDGVVEEARMVVPMLEAEQRKGFAEVELGLDEQMATNEAKRCLNCGIYAETENLEGIEPRELGLRISPGAYVYVLPIEAGFVGADNVAVLIAEEPYNQDDMVLTIDIGTNGELVLGNREKLISSSCATGPAFEGAQMKYGMRAAPGAIEKLEIDPDTKEVRFKVIGEEAWSTDLEEVGAKGICGSGIIDAIAQMFRADIMQRNGRLNTNLETPRLRIADDGPEFVIAWANETSIGQDITVCQADVRAMQLAKGAMYVGAKLMMRHLGVETLDKVVLAGAFGSYIDKKSAATIGLFPDCALENVYAVGNAAGDGARIALLNIEKRKEADKIARQVEYIELTVEPDFEKEFAKAMWFPHMKDTFPHLEQPSSWKADVMSSKKEVES